MVESVITKESCVYCLGEGVVQGLFDLVVCPYCDGTGFIEEEKE